MKNIRINIIVVMATINRYSAVRAAVGAAEGEAIAEAVVMVEGGSKIQQNCYLPTVPSVLQIRPPYMLTSLTFATVTDTSPILS